MEDGPPIFSQDNTCPDLLDFTKSKILDTGLSPTMATLSSAFSYLSSCLRANPRSLAATKGISVDFFSYGYLDVSVPRVRLLHLWIQCRIPICDRWVSPFGHLRINACLSTPRSFSQTTTSFIASSCQGIHRMHLIT